MAIGLISLSITGQNLDFIGIIPTLSQTGRISQRFNYNFFISETIDAFNKSTREIKYPASNLQLYIQPSIIYVHSPNLNFAASLTYNYQKSNPDVPFFKEWRPWEQVIYAHNLSYGRMSHRLRFEERLIKNEETGKWPMTTRLRYQIAFNIPLNGKTLEDNEFYFNCYNEFYFTLTVPEGQIRNALYSEDWAYAGVGYQLPRLGRIEVGPLFQFNVRDRQQDLRNLYLLQVAWITNFNFNPNLWNRIFQKAPKS
jgi:hypothetical protein